MKERYVIFTLSSCCLNIFFSSVTAQCISVSPSTESGMLWSSRLSISGEQIRKNIWIMSQRDGKRKSESTVPIVWRDYKGERM